MDYYRPTPEEILKYGLVFTPNNVIEQMLDQLPKEIWSNPNAKFLDPCAGIGNFPYHIHSRLMKSLANQFETPEECSDHIWENMIYMCEIYEKNSRLLILHADTTSAFTRLNLYHGDFLTADLNAIFGVDKFDVVVGNPPYTVGVLDKKIHTKYYKLAGTGTKKSPHIYFTKCGLDVLKDDGYLLFINPYNYFSNPSAQEYRDFLSTYNYNITLFGDDIFQDVKVTSAIHLITKNDIGQFLIRDGEKTKPLIIDGKIMKTTNLKVQSILSKMTGTCDHCMPRHKSLPKLDKFNFLFGEFRPAKEVEDGEYHIIHGAKTFQCDKEPRDRHSIRLYINEIRNINSYPPISEVWITEDPNIGFSINNLYLICQTMQEAEYIKSYIKSKLFQFVFSKIKDNNHNSRHLLNMFIIPVGLKTDFSEEDLYKYFGLTDDEIQFLK